MHRDCRGEWFRVADTCWTTVVLIIQEEHMMTVDLQCVVEWRYTGPAMDANCERWTSMEDDR